MSLLINRKIPGIFGDIWKTVVERPLQISTWCKIVCAMYVFHCFRNYNVRGISLAGMITIDPSQIRGHLILEFEIYTFTDNI